MRSRKAIEKDANHNAGYLYEPSRLELAGGPWPYVSSLLLAILEVALDIRGLLAERKS